VCPSASSGHLCYLLSNFHVLQPNQAPTSKNYTEMRERLRRRLKKKKATPGMSGGCTKAVTANVEQKGEVPPPSEPKPIAKPVPPVGVVEKVAAPPLHQPEVDELVKFITGQDVSVQQPQKLDKKQRKKQKKVSAWLRIGSDGPLSRG